MVNPSLRAQLQQLDHFGAQFFNLIIIKCQLQRAAGLKVGFPSVSPDSSGSVAFSTA